MITYPLYYIHYKTNSSIFLSTVDTGPSFLTNYNKLQKEGVWEAAYLQQTSKSPLHLPFSQEIIQKEKLAYVQGKKVLKITHFNSAEGLSNLI